MQHYSVFDFLLAPLFFFLILFFGFNYGNQKKRGNVFYTYFAAGLTFKLLGAIALCLVYSIYYKTGGDTLNYHYSGRALVNLFYKSPDDFWGVWLGKPTIEKYLLFDGETGFPIYWRDPYAFNVVRLITPLEFLTFGSYLSASMLMAVLGYTGMWKLYMLFCELYPALYKYFAYSILFMPSVLFWGSGILKDTWTIAAACWYCYTFYRVFIEKNFKLSLIAAFAISILVMISIKPYVFVALLPGSVLWGISGSLNRIKSVFLRVLAVPFTLAFGLGFGFGIWFLVGASLGQYSTVESMLLKAQVTQSDLKADYYQGNSFDIGSFEPTLAGVMSKFPQATVAGLFRPFIWEARNIQMVLSGLENLVILSITVFFLLKTPIGFIRQIFQNPLVMFCILFSVMFAFSVGISTSNFGALVRLKIPLWPFYLSALVIVNYHRLNVQAVFKDRKTKEASEK